MEGARRIGIIFLLLLQSILCKNCGMIGAVKITALDVENDWGKLVKFLTSNRFPFHLDSSPTEQSVERRLEKGDFSLPDNAGYWVLEGGVRVGLAILADIRDPSVLVDLRLRESSRGLGLGVRALSALADTGFSSSENIRCLEGATRDDHIAMQRTFLKAGWVKVSHYRSAGPEINGVQRDILGYSLARADWLTGESNPPDWTVGLSL